MIKSYPKILPLVGKYSEYALGVNVEVTEKIDGSQFVFGKDPDGKLHMRSKGALIQADGDVQILFRPAVDHVLAIQDKLPIDTVFYSETLSCKRHNTLEYNRVPNNHIMLYGMTDFAQTHINPSYRILEQCAKAFDVEAVPLIGEYYTEYLPKYSELLDRESILGGPKVEGIVIKNYHTSLMINNSLVPFVALKLVSEAFKEKHSNNPEYIPQTSKLEQVISAYRTEARWHKAVQHLRDSGLLVGEPKDIALLMPELVRDLVEEEKENFKEELYNIYQKQWKSHVTRGFPEWYKKSLLGETN